MIYQAPSASSFKFYSTFPNSTWLLYNTRLPFTGNENLGTIVYPGGDLHLKALVPRYHTLTTTACTGPAREFTRPLTGRAHLCRLNIERAHASNIGLL